MTATRDRLLLVVAQLGGRLAAIRPRGPCWLIGSAAAVLAGVDGIQPRDLDLLLDRDDASAFIDAHRTWLDGDHAPADGDRFRSCFARFRFDGLPVEVMGGLQVRRAGAWEPVVIERELPLAGIDGPLRVASLPDQLRLLECFGRDKDLRRADLVRRHLARAEASHAA